jgi:outer membrane lipoprotein-sorting protein
MRYFLSVFLLAVVLFSRGAPASVPPLSLPEVQAVEAYLNGLGTLKSRFIQTDNDGKQVGGTFMLKRPGRMRFEYDPPITDFIVADGLLIYYYDGQMKQQSSVPIGHSLANFFLRRELKLSGDVEVSEVKRGGGLLQITLTQTKDPFAGSLTLGLSEKPLELKKWRIVDAQGLITEVELFDSESGIKLDGSKFHYYDPSRKVEKFQSNQ